ncbi:MAG: hypothetical protein GF333_05240 [Candidatus Omnitrophica bacterium]|nr:hypothetical protein [Candidatus Omnitrophota bacterium]
MRENIGIKSVDFKKIRAQFFRYLRTEKRRQKMQAEAAKSAQVDNRNRIDQDEFQKAKAGLEKLKEFQEAHKNEETMKQLRELVEKLKETSITIRFEKDRGLVRAHMFNRVTNQLVAVIPDYFLNGPQEDGRDANSTLFHLKRDVLSFLQGLNQQKNIDRRI